MLATVTVLVKVMGGVSFIPIVSTVQVQVFVFTSVLRYSDITC